MKQASAGKGLFLYHRDHFRACCDEPTRVGSSVPERLAAFHAIVNQFGPVGSDRLL